MSTANHVAHWYKILKLTQKVSIVHSKKAKNKREKREKREYSLY